MDNLEDTYMKDIKHKTSDDNQSAHEVVFGYSAGNDVEIIYLRSKGAPRKDLKGRGGRRKSCWLLYAGWEETCMLPGTIKQTEAA